MFKLIVKGESINQHSLFTMNIAGTRLKKITGNDALKRFSDHDPIFSRDTKRFTLKDFLKQIP